MKRLFKIVGLAGIGLAVLLVIALMTFYRLVQVGELRRFVVSEIEKQTHLRVSVGDAELQMGRVVGISFSDLALMEADSDRPVITAQKALVRMALVPLLKRRIVLYEIRFERPTVRVGRQGEGNISLSELMAYLPLFGQGEGSTLRLTSKGRFTLDLRQVRVEKGEIIFADDGAEWASAIGHLREVDLSLRRIKARPLPRSAGEPQDGASTEAGPTLEFGLRAVIEGEKEIDSARLTSSGTIVFPAGSFDLGQAWWQAQSRVEALPASLFRAYCCPSLPTQAIRGTLASNLSWQGSAARRIHVQGQIDFKRFEFDAPDLLSGVLAPGDGRVELAVEWAPQEIRFQRLGLRAGDIELTMEGSVRSSAEKEPLSEFHLSTPFLPLAAARNYLPWKAIHAPLLEDLFKTMNHGEIKFTRAGVSGPLSEMRRLFEPGAGTDVWLDAELKDAGGDAPGDRYLPLRGVGGRLVLEKGVLYFKNFKGAYGLSRLTEIEGAQKGIFSGKRSLELRAKGEIDLSQLREQLKSGALPFQAAKAADVLQELGGKGRLSLLVRADSAAPPQYTGQLSLDNARLRAGDVSLTQVKGELSISPREIRAEKATALLGGSPVAIRILLSNYLSDRASFDLTVDSSGVKAGEALRLLLSVGSPQDPGTVRGRIHYQGLLASGASRSLSGSLELIGAQLPLKFFRQPLKEVRGKVTFDGNGIELEGLRAQLAGYGFEFSGRWGYAERPQLTFALRSQEMDIASLLPQDDRRGNDWYDRLQAKGRIEIGRGRFEGFEFSGLSTDLALDKRAWRLENFSASSLGGTIQGSGTFADGADGLLFSVEPKVRGVPLQGFLKWFDMGTREITGKINLNGKLESHGNTGAERKRNLTGSFQLEIKDGLARRLQLLVRILNVMDLTRWFSFQLPDLTQKGIRFRSVTGDFKVKKGVYFTDNLVVDSDDISITGAGNYDGPNDVVDAVLALRPFPRLGSVVSYIPLIGPGIAGIKDTVMVASFHVQGPVDDAVVTPAPLGTLSEWFFSALKLPQKLITIPGTGKK